MTVALGALATVFSGWIAAIPAQLTDPEAAKDRIRSGSDFSLAVDIVRLDDEGKNAAFRGDFRPTAAERAMLSRPGAAATPAFDRLMHTRGAVSVDDLTVRLTLTGHRNQQINILDIRPAIVERTAPLSGTFFCVPPQGGVSTMTMVFDMDRPSPLARDAEVTALGRPFFGRRTITLHDREQRVVIARAFTADHYVAFRLNVTYMLGDKKKHTVIDDHGKPFQVTAISPGKGYRSVFSLQADYSVCRSAGQDLPAAARKACTPC
ncbi:hypothetical protein [Streptomyces odontomachi]|uniref:hypothetical protein n=1 Tax=Streptomyces odontomachi TaxID=2944940 RepID=UPI002109CB79|nr:hypothetical protein [Streptomyces sp. ODS25]